jgi:predicted transport protein
MTQPLRLNALEEVPYALGLIRQTLERQLEGDS